MSCLEFHWQRGTDGLDADWGDERRIDWSIEEQFHVSAHSFKKKKKSRASAALARHFEFARYVLRCKIKNQRLSGRPKELSGFYRLVHLHASSSGCVLSDLCFVLSLSVSSFPLSFPTSAPQARLQKCQRFLCPPVASDLVITIIVSVQHQHFRGGYRTPQSAKVQT